MRSRPLTELSSRQLRPLLDEEARHWASELSWDYAEVSAAVASGLSRGALAGRFMEERSRPVAYGYYMIDGGRAIVGSLFASRGFRGHGLEECLLDAILAEAQADRENQRVECQTLFSTASEADAHFSRAGFAGRPRHYMTRRLVGAVGVPDHSFDLRAVRREDLEPAALIIHESHRESLDAALNLTYATPAHCRNFVETLVLRAGCGRFDTSASLVAEERGRMVGILLASRLSAANGHVCQVSVAPDVQGRGLGSVLMTSALEAFRRQGVEMASLSVTVGNQRAYGLYERLGFSVRAVFAAHAWVRPPARIELPA